MGKDHVDVEAVARRATRASTLLGKWRTWFASWQVGTRPEGDGEIRAIKDHREATMLLRAEVNALTRLMLEKGVVSQVELTQAFADEYEALNAAYAARFPGIEATEHGLAMDVAKARDLMRDLGFPP